MAARTPAKRQNKKVAGSTKGIARRAMTKPVLQISTNIGAMMLSKLSFMGNLLKILEFFNQPFILGSFDKHSCTPNLGSCRFFNITMQYIH
jgi:hypothetical protein